MTDNNVEDSERWDEPSQYGDGGAAVYGSDGEPVALLFASWGGWKLPLERDPVVDGDAEDHDSK